MAVPWANKVYFLGLPCFYHFPLEDMIVIELPVWTVVSVDIDLLIVNINA